MNPVWLYATEIFIKVSEKLSENFNPQVNFLEILQKVV